jgi:hypothetical protein
MIKDLTKLVNQNSKTMEAEYEFEVEKDLMSIGIEISKNEGIEERRNLHIA